MCMLPIASAGGGAISFRGTLANGLGEGEAWFSGDILLAIIPLQVRVSFSS